MAISDYQPTLSSLRVEVGRFLGYGGQSGNWDAAKLADITSAINKGLGMFYNHPPVRDPLNANKTVVHKWGFLYPKATIITVADDAEQDLPDDFADIISDFYYQPDVNSYPIKLSAAHEIDRLKQTHSSTGKPYLFAIRPKTFDGKSGQLFEVVWFYTPDAAYTLTYQYSVIPRQLSALRPYPYGSAFHAQTIIEACLAAAEIQKNRERGLHWEMFMENLGTSITNDRNMFTQGNLGYNSDCSDNRGEQSIISTSDAVTYNGVQY